MNKKVIDMTKGSPFRIILVFAIPIALGFALQQLYIIGDSLIVSLSLGANATTGVNLTGTFVFLVQGFAQGITAGMGIVLSQFVGAKNKEKMRQSVATALTICISVAIVLGLVSAIFARPVLELMQTSEEHIDYAVSYVRTVLIGLVFTVLYNLSDQIMRAMGDSKTPLIILIICACLNIGLNSLLFIFPTWTVAWAGWATVISQALSAIVGFVIIFRRFTELRVKKKDFRISFAFAWHHLRIGIPMAFEFMITALGCMIQQRAFNVLGAIDLQNPQYTYAMAQTTASRVDNIFGCFLNGCGVAMATFVGQNYGAKNYTRIKKGFFSAMLVGAIFTVFSTIGAISTCYPMFKLLLPGVDTRVYELGFRYILIQSLQYYALLMVFVPRQAVQALGKSALAVFGGIIELALRTIVAFTFAVWFGFDGAVLSNPLAWWGASIYLVIAFFVQINKLIKTQRLDNKNEQERDIKEEIVV